VLTKSKILNIDLGYYIDFSEAQFENLQFTTPYGKVVRKSYATNTVVLSDQMVPGQVLNIYADYDPLYWFYVTAYDKNGSLCIETMVSSIQGSNVWDESMSEAECASYKLLSIQQKDRNQYMKSRLLVEGDTLYSYITESTRHNSG
jgi:hypothetical protein